MDGGHYLDAGPVVCRICNANVSKSEFGTVQKRVDLVDLVKSFPSSNEYLLAKMCVDSAENEPSKVSSFIPPGQLCFTLIAHRGSELAGWHAGGALHAVERRRSERGRVFLGPGLSLV